MGNCLPLAFSNFLAGPLPSQSEQSKAHSRSGPRFAASTSSVLPRATENFKELFDVGRMLGQGQFGITYLCLERSSGLEYACKMIEKRKLRASQDFEDVRREISIMHHLSGGTHIVTLRGAYEDASFVYLVMELCAGGELFNRIIQRGHYSEREAARLIRVIVTVLEFCHSLGVMHRDLKPENFLFSNDEEDAPLKAIDFGLSVFFKPGEIFEDVVGSPYYVAPEVLKKSYGPEADVWSAGVILYILLCGVPPFWAETEQGIFQEVLNGVLDFTTDPWPKISSSSKELIGSMLNRNPKERFTVHQVLCHPWICEDGVAPDHPLGPAVLSRMKNFMTMNKMKKIALRIIAERLSDEEIAGLKETFKMMDADGSGSITFEELKAGLQRMGSGLVDNEIRVLMEAADIDNSGTIDYEEFIAATMHLNKFYREEYLAAAFSYFDKDGSGFITEDELKQACAENKMNDAEVQDIMKEIDQNNDGCIDYSEFVSMMCKSSGGVSRRTLRYSLKPALENSEGNLAHNTMS